MTLSNPGGMNFTPASAPIVLKRVTDRIPQLGFLRPGAPDYDSYRQELEAVALRSASLLPRRGRPRARRQGLPRRHAYRW